MKLFRKKYSNIHLFIMDCFQRNIGVYFGQNPVYARPLPYDGSGVEHKLVNLLHVPHLLISHHMSGLD